MIREAPGPKPDLSGLKILVAEDEVFVAYDLETWLSDLGSEVMGPVASAAEGLSLLAERTPDLAILDVGLRDGEVTPIVDALRSLGVPFLLLTGYGPSRVADLGLEDVIRLDKPCMPGDIHDALLRLARVPCRTPPCRGRMAELRTKR